MSRRVATIHDQKLPVMIPPSRRESEGERQVVRREREVWSQLLQYSYACGTLSIPRNHTCNFTVVSDPPFAVIRTFISLLKVWKTWNYFWQFLRAMQGLKKKKSVKVRLFKSEILGSGSDTVVRVVCSSLPNLHDKKEIADCSSSCSRFCEMTANSVEEWRCL